jgi:ABC-type antimicrobial peptide transport system permease subunit
MSDQPPQRWDWEANDLISEKFVTRRLCALLVTLFSGAALFLSNSLGISILALGLAATLACLPPALKALRINPTEALRE